MKTYIVLLRGINVSGKNKIPMASLRTMLEEAGYTHVHSYIQSGNIIFRTKEEDAKDLSHQVGKLIEKHYTFTVPVIAIPLNRFIEMYHNNPFKEEYREQSYTTFLFEVPLNEQVSTFSNVQVTSEKVILGDGCLYSHYKKGYGKAKINNNYIERMLQVTATTRNFKTVSKLVALAQSM